MRPRRAIRTLLVFVLLGATATVLTSWAIHAVHFWRLHRQPLTTWPLFVVRVEQSPPSSAMRDDGVEAWHSYRVPPMTPDASRWSRASVEAPSRLQSVGWRLDVQGMRAVSNERDNWGRTLEVLSVFDSGWPIHAMRHGTYTGVFLPEGAPKIETRTTGTTLHGGLQRITWRRHAAWTTSTVQGAYHPLDRFALPLLPLWPGFLINTLFYALLLFIAWRVPFALRRAVRRRRGRCGACGYDRAGLDVAAACPECGAHMGHRPRRSAVAG